MLRLRNLSLNGAHVHVIIRVCTAPLIISHISSWSSTPRRTRTFSTCNVVGKALRIHPRLLSENLHQLYLFIYFLLLHLICVQIQILALQWKSFQTSESEQFASALAKAGLIQIHEAKARWMPSLALSRLRTRLCDRDSRLLDGSSLAATSPLTH